MSIYNLCHPKVPLFLQGQRNLTKHADLELEIHSLQWGYLVANQGKYTSTIPYTMSMGVTQWGRFTKTCAHRIWLTSNLSLFS